MGYPMTFQRVVNRNGLSDGDYNEPPSRHRSAVITNATEATTMSPDETMAARAPLWAEQVDRYERAFSMLAGDLRRLERDALDETSICHQIAWKTGIDLDTVAAVLKEFMAT